MDYTAWPLASDVQELVASANVCPTLDWASDLVQVRLDAAVAELEQLTGRQFLAAEGLRYFDGSGTGVLVVDEYVSISAVQFYLVPELAGVNLLDFMQVTRNRYANTRIQIYQGPANIPLGWYTRFPEGRSNVGVTATWGYAASIPPDVWQAVLAKAAAEIVDTNRVAARGALVSIRDDDVSVGYSEQLPSVMAGWRQQFASVCKRYRRGVREMASRTRPGLV